MDLELIAKEHGSREASYLDKLASRLDLADIKESFYFPKYFEIETVNACNARCVMCTIDDWEQSRNPIMDEKLFSKFVDEISLYTDWIDTVCLNRDGEPTLDKNLHKKISRLIPQVHFTDIIMKNQKDKLRLAKETIKFANKLVSN